MNGHTNITSTPLSTASIAAQFSAQNVGFSQTHTESNLLSAYLQEQPTLAELYTYPPTLSGFKKALANATTNGYKHIDRASLVKVLTAQNKHLALSQSSTYNIQALRHANTFTVCTGHQPNLMSGPLYFWYKIISTIKLAHQLQQHYPSYHFVPIYWLGGEDHDFEEINHFYLFGNKLSWQNKHTGSVGSMPTNDGSLALIFKELENIFGTSPHAAELLQLLQSAYLQPNRNLAEATRYLVNQLLGKYGLVILSGNNAQLKKAFAPIMQQELQTQGSQAAVAQTNKKLTELGYRTQAHARPINLFYLNPSNNLRERITLHRKGYQLHKSQTIFSQSALLQELEQHPQRFSPNVILRPVYQQHILPNLAYIGGGGELAYWLQLKQVFAHYHVYYPMLLRRNSALWIDKNSQKKLANLSLSAVRFFEDQHSLIHQFIAEQSENELQLTDFKQAAEKLFTDLGNSISTIDVQLKKSAEAEAAKVAKSIDNLEAKVRRAEKRKHDTALQQIEGVYQKLFPEGKPQERYNNFMELYLKYGEIFIAVLYHYFQPLQPGFTLISPK